jgi:hypothetical protein
MRLTEPRCLEPRLSPVLRRPAHVVRFVIRTDCARVTDKPEATPVVPEKSGFLETSSSELEAGGPNFTSVPVFRGFGSSRNALFSTTENLT